MTVAVRSRRPLVAAVLAGAALLVVGFFYLASGLVVPGYALVPLWLWWGVQAWVLVRLARARSWWVLAVPVVAVATWWLVLAAGEAWLGWQP
ncbi:hypothetical protein [Modestobacter versicolor]|uniref:Uncharacterized protein n=1 Tax=Modestobacter versicolor TaxID=429133 RepID=A0A323V7K6_9ACTN|nr:hypothetical protein [Modestobacter versicolor]MBB3674624.1 hypothetical protein [Modestobacter versicolor]PZA19296.1 hypothetical protein DMO24_21495 [Modestobacter versicolor]